MALTENAEFVAAIAGVGEALEGDAAAFDEASKDADVQPRGLRGASLLLARTCRAEIAEEWSSFWSRRLPRESWRDTAFPSEAAEN